MKVVIEDIGWSTELADLLPSTRMRNLQTRAQVAETNLAQVLEALEAWLELASHCTIEDGVCCCGDDMDRHANPMDCGHSPMDHGTYIAGRLAAHTEATIAAVSETHKLKGEKMTDKGFDEYSFYGENNPPVGESEPKPVMSLDEKEDGFSITFIEEEHLPDGNVKLTFDVGDKAMHEASEAGLKLFLYMGALNITEEQAFTAIWETYKEEPLYVGETAGE